MSVGPPSLKRGPLAWVVGASLRMLNSDSDFAAQTPDGLIVTDESIVVLEWARTDDEGDMWSRRRRASKQRTYAALRTALQQLFPTKTIREWTLITGIRFSLDEAEWEDTLRDALGITGGAAVAIQRTNHTL